MGEITAPIIAITLVLLSVFVPVRVHPRHHRRAVPQFAVAVSVSMLISAINALSSSPALCSVLLTKPRPAARAGGLDAGRHRPDDGRLRLDRPPAGPGRDPQPRRPGRRLLPHRRGLQGHAAGLPAGGGPGRHLRHPAAARGRLAEPHVTTVAQMEEIIRASRRSRASPRRRLRLHQLDRLLEQGASSSG